MGDSFTWRDGERLIRFGRGVAAEAPALLAENGFASFVLLTTERAENALPSLRDEEEAGPLPKVSGRQPRTGERGQSDGEAPGHRRRGRARFPSL